MSASSSTTTGHKKEWLIVKGGSLEASINHLKLFCTSKCMDIQRLFRRIEHQDATLSDDDLNPYRRPHAFLQYVLDKRAEKFDPVAIEMKTALAQHAQLAAAQPFPAVEAAGRGEGGRGGRAPGAGRGGRGPGGRGQGGYAVNWPQLQPAEAGGEIVIIQTLEQFVTLYMRGRHDKAVDSLASKFDDDEKEYIRHLGELFTEVVSLLDPSMMQLVCQGARWKRLRDTANIIGLFADIRSHLLSSAENPKDYAYREFFVSPGIKMTQSDKRDHASYSKAFADGVANLQEYGWEVDENPDLLRQIRDLYLNGLNQSTFGPFILTVAKQTPSGQEKDFRQIDLEAKDWKKRSDEMKTRQEEQERELKGSRAKVKIEGAKAMATSSNTKGQAAAAVGNAAPTNCGCIQCDNCDEMGHVFSNCPKQKAWCDHCKGYVGHLTHRCRNTMNRLSQSGRGRNQNRGRGRMDYRGSSNGRSNNRSDRPGRGDGDAKGRGQRRGNGRFQGRGRADGRSNTRGRGRGRESQSFDPQAHAAQQDSNGEWVEFEEEEEQQQTDAGPYDEGYSDQFHYGNQSVSGRGRSRGRGGRGQGRGRGLGGYQGGQKSYRTYAARISALSYATLSSNYDDYIMVDSLSDTTVLNATNVLPLSNYRTGGPSIRGINGIGDPVDGQGKAGILGNCLVHSASEYNLIPADALLSALGGDEIRLRANGMAVVDSTGRIIVQGEKDGRFWRIKKTQLIPLLYPSQQTSSAHSEGAIALAGTRVKRTRAPPMHPRHAPLLNEVRHLSAVTHGSDNELADLLHYLPNAKASTEHIQLLRLTDGIDMARFSTYFKRLSYGESDSLPPLAIGKLICADIIAFPGIQTMGYADRFSSFTDYLETPDGTKSTRSMQRTCNDLIHFFNSHNHRLEHLLLDGEHSLGTTQEPGNILGVKVTSTPRGQKNQFWEAQHKRVKARVKAIKAALDYEYDVDIHPRIELGAFKYCANIMNHTPNPMLGSGWAPAEILYNKPPRIQISQMVPFGSPVTIKVITDSGSTTPNDNFHTGILIKQDWMDNPLDVTIYDPITKRRHRGNTFKIIPAENRHQLYRQWGFKSNLKLNHIVQFPFESIDDAEERQMKVSRLIGHDHPPPQEPPGVPIIGAQPQVDSAPPGAQVPPGALNPTHSAGDVQLVPPGAPLPHGAEPNHVASQGAPLQLPLGAASLELPPGAANPVVPPGAPTPLPHGAAPVVNLAHYITSRDAPGLAHALADSFRHTHEREYLTAHFMPDREGDLPNAHQSAEHFCAFLQRVADKRAKDNAINQELQAISLELEAYPEPRIMAAKEKGNAGTHLMRKYQQGNAAKRHALKQALSKEMSSLAKLGVGKAVSEGDLTNEDYHKMMYSMLILKEKFLPSGEFEKLKARLVVLGNRMREGTYGETFAPTVGHASTMLLLSMYTLDDADIGTYDIPSAFPNTPYDSSTQGKKYLVLIPPAAKAWIESRPEDAKHLTIKGELILELEKFLYGMRDASAAFHNYLQETLEKQGFACCISDVCVMVKIDDHTGEYLISSGHVDDLLVGTSKGSSKLRQEFEQCLTRVFGSVERKDINESGNYVGIYIRRNRSSRQTFLSQPEFISRFPSKHPHINWSSSNATPGGNDFFCDDSDTDPYDSTKYKSMVADLLYVSYKTMWATLMEASHLASCPPTQGAAKKVERALRWVYQNRDAELRLAPTEHCIDVWADASYGVHYNGYSQTAIVFRYGGSPFYVVCRKQRIVAVSSTDAEYDALTEATKHVEWIRGFLWELGPYFHIPDHQPIVIYQDNLSTKTLAEKPSTANFRRSKHALIRYAYVQSHAKAGTIKIEWIETNKMIADVLTKPLQGEAFKKGVEGLGLVGIKYGKKIKMD